MQRATILEIKNGRSLVRLGAHFWRVVADTAQVVFLALEGVLLTGASDSASIVVKETVVGAVVVTVCLVVVYVVMPICALKLIFRTTTTTTFPVVVVVVVLKISSVGTHVKSARTAFYRQGIVWKTRMSMI